MKTNVFVVFWVLALFMPLNLLGVLPLSKQAQFIESHSASEVMLNATGIYYGSGRNARERRNDVERNGEVKATEDAQKSAVYFILFSGNDHLIRTNDERRRFDAHETHFFDITNISRYINYIEPRIQNIVYLNNDEAVMLSRMIQVDVEKITRDLEELMVIERRVDIMTTIGFPMIMVIPETSFGQNPIEVLRTDPIIRNATSVVVSHLTQRRFEVLDPQQAELLDSLNEVQLLLGDREEDLAYAMALTIGSDVYITLGGFFESTEYNTQRYAVTVKAFETTTARLITSETGYSQGRQGEASISVEEAVNVAITNVLSKIISYWQDDIHGGVQYKIAVSISPSLSNRDVDDIKDAFMDSVDAVSKHYSENIATRQILDYLVWVDPERFPNSNTLYREIRDRFDRTAFSEGLTTIKINRKMILFRVDYM